MASVSNWASFAGTTICCSSESFSLVVAIARCGSWSASFFAQSNICWVRSINLRGGIGCVASQWRYGRKRGSRLSRPTARPHSPTENESCTHAGWLRRIELQTRPSPGALDAACNETPCAPRRLVVTRSRKRTGAWLPEAGGSLLADHPRQGNLLRRLFNPLGLHLLSSSSDSLEFAPPTGSRVTVPTQKSNHALWINYFGIIVF